MMFRMNFCAKFVDRRERHGNSDFQLNVLFEIKITFINYYYVSFKKRILAGPSLKDNRKSSTLYFFKVAFSTFWFKFGATLRRQAERRDSGTRQ